MKQLLRSYIGTNISVLSAAKKISGTLMYVCDDYIAIEIGPELIDVVKMDHIVALEGLKHETFLAAIGQKRAAVHGDMLARAEQLATTGR